MRRIQAGHGLWSEFPYSATYRAADSLAGGANGETAALSRQARVAGGQAEGQAVLAAREAAMLQAGVRGESPGEELVAAAGYSRRTGDFRKRPTRLLHDEYPEWACYTHNCFDCARHPPAKPIRRRLETKAA